jgi:RimJ/RimL family protein N-acetyltransferase
MTTPLGPVVDATPRPLPVRQAIRGRTVVLEPLHPRHVDDLWAEAEAGVNEHWAYLGYGPFPTRAALAAQVATFAAEHDPMVWAIRPVRTGVVAGWLSLLDIQPRNAAIELGHIWLGSSLQRTVAATEAMFLLLRMAADDLGYRRLVWKCNALNAPSRQAAARLGFTYEGTLRSHMVSKGRDRDTAMFSILAAEWPAVREALVAWLDPGNFDAEEAQRHRLSDLRGNLARPPALEGLPGVPT